MAAKADRHELYELSVQAPKVDAATLARIFKRYRKRHAMTLREDFCGTAVLSAAWAKSKKGRSAIGVDLDQPIADYGEGDGGLGAGNTNFRKGQRIAIRIIYLSAQINDKCPVILVGNNRII